MRGKWPLRGSCAGLMCALFNEVDPRTESLSGFRHDAPADCYCLAWPFAFITNTAQAVEPSPVYELRNVSAFGQTRTRYYNHAAQGSTAHSKQQCRCQCATTGAGSSYVPNAVRQQSTVASTFPKVMSSPCYINASVSSSGRSFFKSTMIRGYLSVLCAAPRHCAGKSPRITNVSASSRRQASSHDTIKHQPEEEREDREQWQEAAYPSCRQRVVLR